MTSNVLCAHLRPYFALIQGTVYEESFRALSFLLIIKRSNRNPDNFRVKSSANIANLRASVDNITATLDSKPGFHGGLFFTIPAAKNFSIQPEEFIQWKAQAMIRQIVRSHCTELICR